MTTRIMFNGQEYASAEAMPEDVRKTYQQALAQLADGDHNGIPDVLERGGTGKGNVIGVQNSSITVNGKTYGSVGEMPDLVRFLYDQALNQLDPNLAGLQAALQRSPAPGQSPPVEGSPPKPTGQLASPPDEGLMRVLDQSESVLSTVLVVVLAAAAGAVIVFGGWMITHMDASSRSQGGVLYVSLALVVVLGAIAGQFISLWRRRQKQ